MLDILHKYLFPHLISEAANHIYLTIETIHTEASLETYGKQFSQSLYTNYTVIHVNKP